MILSVIIPTCNRIELLAKCLELLSPSNQSVDQNCYEVIVTDDSLTDEARNFISSNFNWAKWVKGTRRGPSANRNNGARHAAGEWLVFIDDDCLPDRLILENYHKAIGAFTDYKAFEGSIVPDSWDALKKDMSECPVNTSGGLFWSANICIERELFEKLKGFDETFLIAAQEDQDIYQRLLKITQVKFLPDAVVTHPVRTGSLAVRIKKIPISVRNWYLYERKLHRQSAGRIFVLTFKLLKDYLKLTILHLLKGRIRDASYFFAFIFIGIPVYWMVSIKD